MMIGAIYLAIFENAFRARASARYCALRARKKPAQMMIYRRVGRKKRY